MANTFYKVSKSRERQQFIDSMMNSYQRRYCESVNSTLNEDLFSLVSGLQKSRIRSEELDLNTLLKYYLLNQIMGSNEKQETAQNKYIDTFNPDIKTDIKGKYYRVKDDTYTLDESIVRINKDGSYETQEIRKGYNFKIIKTYDKKHQNTDLKIENSIGHLIQDRYQVAEMLNLHQEYQTKHKYSGVSGNSKDILNKLLNKFTKPEKTGYYVDLYCSAWQWNINTFSFNRVFSRDEINKRPYSVDIEFQTNGTVIRQEYTGIGV